MAVAGVDRPARRARAMYRALGVSAVEFLWLAMTGRRELERVTVDEGSIGPWRGALSRGRGVVIAASHTGHWDLAACAIARAVELTVVTKHLTVRWLDRLWQKTRASLGVNLVDARGAMAAAREALGRAGAVAMMIDQVPAYGRRVLLVDFLGRPALADRAAAVLSAASGAPLVVAASRRLDGGSHRLYVLDVHFPPARPGRAWIDETTRAATLALDRFVRLHPSQWLWLHRRWRGATGASSAMLASSCQTRSSSPAAPSRAA